MFLAKPVGFPYRCEMTVEQLVSSHSASPFILLYPTDTIGGNRTNCLSLSQKTQDVINCHELSSTVRPLSIVLWIHPLIINQELKHRRSTAERGNNWGIPWDFPWNHKFLTIQVLQRSHRNCRSVDGVAMLSYLFHGETIIFHGKLFHYPRLVTQFLMFPLAPIPSSKLQVLVL